MQYQYNTSTTPMGYDQRNVIPVPAPHSRLEKMRLKPMAAPATKATKYPVIRILNPGFRQAELKVEDRNRGRRRTSDAHVRDDCFARAGLPNTNVARDRDERSRTVPQITLNLRMETPMFRYQRIPTGVEDLVDELGRMPLKRSSGARAACPNNSAR